MESWRLEAFCSNAGNRTLADFSIRTVARGNRFNGVKNCKR